MRSLPIKYFIAVIIIIVFGFVWFCGTSIWPYLRPGSQSVNKTNTEKTVIYSNNQYGFSFSLPQDWKGFSIATITWEGYSVGPSGDTPVEHGPLILIRNPKWTAKNPYQDIPIMIFTSAQWDALMHDQFHIGAAPINPSLLASNNRFVFALPARYNFSFLTGYESVDKILQAKPLQTWNLSGQ